MEPARVFDLENSHAEHDRAKLGTRARISTATNYRALWSEAWEVLLSKSPEHRLETRSFYPLIIPDDPHKRKQSGPSLNRLSLQPSDTCQVAS